MDRIDRDLLAALLVDGRATYQELGRRVHLAPNTVAERVKRLQKSGVLKGFRAEIDPASLGRSLTLLIDVRLREGVDRAWFERGLADVPQVTAAVHVTGEYDYELRVIAAHAAEIESIIDRLKRDHGVRELRSRLLLGEVPLGPAGLLHEPLPAAPPRSRS
jgi:Lrp/AsnC family transcriptional regulator, leucine-responsive regulatory protein